MQQQQQSYYQPQHGPNNGGNPGGAPRGPTHRQHYPQNSMGANGMGPQAHTALRMPTPLNQMSMQQVQPGAVPFPMFPQSSRPGQPGFSFGMPNAINGVSQEFILLYKLSLGKSTGWLAWEKKFKPGVGNADRWAWGRCEWPAVLSRFFDITIRPLMIRFDHQVRCFRPHWRNRWNLISVLYDISLFYRKVRTSECQN